MTATIKPSAKGDRARRRALRFSSMESLGFSDATSVWTDSETPLVEPEKGRHVAPMRAPETLADWAPEDFGRQLTGRDVRWHRIAAVVLVVGTLAGFGFWLYQRPEARDLASVGDVRDQARMLATAMPTLVEFNEGLTGDGDTTSGTAALFEVESVARTLFEASASLPDDQLDMRSTSSDAAGSAIDGLRLVGDAHSYRSAVLPYLTAPALETDPSLIELDQAARSFGEWQLRFDEMRTALPDGILPDVTRQVDVLSGDLTSIMGRYVDALRQDDGPAAVDVVADLRYRLTQIDSSLSAALGDIQRRVQVHIGEADRAIQALLAD